MTQADYEPHEGAQDERRRVWLGLLIALSAFFFFLALFVPNLDVDKRQRANEASAVNRLRRLSEFQKRYAATNPKRGFACHLSELEPTAPVEDTYDQNEFLAAGEQTGYKFALTGCQRDLAGVVVQYQVTAVPIVAGQTGFRAFCSDRSGVIWYDSDPSGEHCLASRRSLD